MHAQRTNAHTLDSNLVHCCIILMIIKIIALNILHSPVLNGSQPFADRIMLILQILNTSRLVGGNELTINPYLYGILVISGLPRPVTTVMGSLACATLMHTGPLKYTPSLIRVFISFFLETEINPKGGEVAE